MAKNRVAESARGISPRAAHRSGRETLASSGSCHPKEGCRLPSRQGVHPVTRCLHPNVDGLLPLLHGSYPASSLLRSSPSLASASVLSASWFCHLCVFPCHHRPGSQVPYESQDTSHAFYTPDIAWAVSRSLPYCSQSKCKTPVLMSSEGFFRRFFEGEFALISRIHT